MWTNELMHICPQLIRLPFSCSCSLATTRSGATATAAFCQCCGQKHSIHVCCCPSRPSVKKVERTDWTEDATVRWEWCCASERGLACNLHLVSSTEFGENLNYSFLSEWDHRQTKQPAYSVGAPSAASASITAALSKSIKTECVWRWQHYQRQSQHDRDASVFSAHSCIINALQICRKTYQIHSGLPRWL